MTSSLIPTDYRAWKAEAAARDRLWRAGYDAGLREDRRLVVVGIAVAGLVLLRRHVHPIVAIGWTLLFVLVLSPLFALALSFEVTRREHQRWHYWPLTMAMFASWLAGFGLVYLAVRLDSLWPFLPIPFVIVAWIADHWHRSLRIRRTTTDRIPLVDDEGAWW